MVGRGRGQKRRRGGQRDQVKVMNFYDKHKSQGRSGRNQSKVAQLRKLNNWIKSTLIKDYVRPGDTVFDMCGGKGGDLGKFDRVGQLGEVVFADHALNSVQEAMSRYNSMFHRNNRGHRGNSRRQFPLTLACADLTDINIWEADEEEGGDHKLANVWVDVVSCQFAFHYSWESDDRATTMIQNVVSRLKPGGFWIGTTTDASVLVRKWRDIRNDPKNPRKPEDPANHTFGSDLYKVQFNTLGADGKHDPNLVQKKLPRNEPFGVKYTFTLEDAVDTVPEFLVPFHILAEMCQGYGLELVKQENFHEYFLKNCANTEKRQLLDRMGVLGPDGTIAPKQWDIAYLYTVFVFRKKRDPDSVVPQTRERPIPRPLEADDIMGFEHY